MRERRRKAMFIELKNAVKRYGTGETLVYALDHAALSLESGESA